MKGSVQDILTVISIILYFSIIVFIAHRVMLGLQGTDLDAYGTVTTMESKSHIYDIGLAFLTILLILVILAKAWELRTNPVFFPAVLVIGAFAVILAAQYSNIFYQLATMSEFATTTATYPIIYGINLNLPTITLVVVLLMLGVALFARGESPVNY